ncbi:MAG: DUF4258 domain-containing protein [bacterium]|nr:DUF4258 domain-containing protein [bacterium]
MNINLIREAISKNKIRITDHADEEAQNDRLSFTEIYHSAIEGEIIEDYPTDKPYPSCLIYGNNSKGMPVHSVWAYNEENGWAVLITVYKPDPGRWINFKQRKKKEKSQ